MDTAPHPSSVMGDAAVETGAVAVSPLQKSFVVDQSDTNSKGCSSPLVAKHPQAGLGAQLAEHKQPRKELAGKGLRDQIETLQATVNSQLVNLRQNSERHTARAASQLEARLADHEAQLAQLAGRIRGIMEELSGQGRRIDATETRPWEWRRAIEQSLDERFARFEQELGKRIEKVIGAIGSSEDVLSCHAQRLSHIESIVDSQLSGCTLESLAERLSSLELEVRGSDVAHAMTARFVSDSNGTGNGDSVAGLRFQSVADEIEKDPALVMFEHKTSELSTKLEWVQNELLNSQARIEEQEVRLASARSRLDAQEEHYRVLADRMGNIRIEYNVDSLKQGLRQQAQDHELLAKRTEEIEATQRDMGDEIVRWVREEFAGLTDGLDLNFSSRLAAVAECAETEHNPGGVEHICEGNIDTVLKRAVDLQAEWMTPGTHLADVDGTEEVCNSQIGEVCAASEEQELSMSKLQTGASPHTKKGQPQGGNLQIDEELGSRSSVEHSSNVVREAPTSLLGQAPLQTVEEYVPMTDPREPSGQSDRHSRWWGFGSEARSENEAEQGAVARRGLFALVAGVAPRS